MSVCLFPLLISFLEGLSQFFLEGPAVQHIFLVENKTNQHLQLADKFGLLFLGKQIDHLRRKVPQISVSGGNPQKSLICNLECALPDNGGLCLCEGFGVYFNFHLAPNFR